MMLNADLNPNRQQQSQLWQTAMDKKVIKRRDFLSVGPGKYS